MLFSVQDNHLHCELFSVNESVRIRVMVRFVVRFGDRVRIKDGKMA